MKQILLVRSGSRAYGVETPESDYDTTGVCIEPFDAHMSVNRNPFEQYHRSEDDGTVFSLAKFCRLAAAGNPNIVEVLYSPVLESTEEGQELINNRTLFWSKRAGVAFLGYMRAQHERLLGLRGQKDVTRQELVEKYGYDTKYAYHIVRLGIIGSEYLRTAHITLPLQDMYKSNLRAIREGKWTLNDVSMEAEKWETSIKERLTRDYIPEYPDHARINAMLERAYLSNWSVNFTLDK